MPRIFLYYLFVCLQQFQGLLLCYLGVHLLNIDWPYISHSVNIAQIKAFDVVGNKLMKMVQLELSYLLYLSLYQRMPRILERVTHRGVRINQFNLPVFFCQALLSL